MKRAKNKVMAVFLAILLGIAILPPFGVRASSPEQCTISFDANGGTGAMAPIVVDKGESFTLPVWADDFTPPEGYYFKSLWELNREKKRPGTQITVNTDITLKALWGLALSDYLRVEDLEKTYTGMILEPKFVSTTEKTLVRDIDYWVDYEPQQNPDGTTPELDQGLPKDVGEYHVQVMPLDDSPYAGWIGPRFKILPGENEEPFLPNTTYTVTLATPIEHGTVSADKESDLHEGELVTLTVTPDEGYELEFLTVKDDETNLVKMETPTTFKMPAANVNVDAFFKKREATPERPAQVQNLMARVLNKTSIHLTWDANGADMYAIFRFIPGSPLEYLYVVDGSRPHFTDMKPIQGKYNFYFVFAYNTTDGVKTYGPASKYAFAKPETAKPTLGPVTGLKAQAVGPGQVKLTWDRHPGADKYAIFRKGEGKKLDYLYVKGQDTPHFVDLHAKNDVYNFYWVIPFKVEGGTKTYGPAGKYVFAKPTAKPPVR